MLSERATKTLGAGMTMAVVAGVFAYGGYWLDGALGTLPLFVVLGVVLGFVGGFVHLLAAVAPEMLPWRARSRGAKPPPDSPDPR